MSKHRRAEAAKRSPSKPKYAHGCVCKAGETPAPDLRAIRLDDRFTAYVRLELRLADGCAVLGIGRSGERKVGRYLSGPPKQFAEFVDLWEGMHTKDAKVRKRKPLSDLLVHPARIVGMSENLLASEQRAKGKRSRSSAA